MGALTVGTSGPKVEDIVYANVRRKGREMALRKTKLFSPIRDGRSRLSIAMFDRE
jgi:hypothetical protein